MYSVKIDVTMNKKFIPYQTVSYKGYVWVFINVENDQAILENPYNHKQFKVPFGDVNYTSAFYARRN